MKRARATVADITRAIRAADKATEKDSLPRIVEIDPSGTIRIVLVDMEKIEEGQPAPVAIKDAVL